MESLRTAQKVSEKVDPLNDTSRKATNKVAFLHSPGRCDASSSAKENDTWVLVLGCRIAKSVPTICINKESNEKDASWNPDQYACEVVNGMIWLRQTETHTAIRR